MIDRTPDTGTPDTGKALDLAGGLSDRLPWRARVVPEDEDDFFLDEVFVDDYEYRRQQARRPDHPEQAYMDFHE